LKAKRIWIRKIFGKRKRRRRCAVKEKEEPSLLSFKRGGEGAVSETSPLMRRFKKRPLPHPQHTISTPPRLANFRGATGPLPLHLHMVLWPHD
jgi:hypothetical protein